MPSDDLHAECTFRGHRSLGPPTRREPRTECNLQMCSREPQDSGGKTVSARQKAAASSSTVPDDWDDASSSEEDNQKVWDNAYGIFFSNLFVRLRLMNPRRCRNKSVPMPQLVVTSSRTGPISSVVPPASAFPSPIRILKRSATSTQNSVTDGFSTSATTTETFAERSARYNAARERIFAGTAEGSVGPGDGVPVPVSTIIRNPKGPEHAPGPNGQDQEGPQGFRARAGKRGSSSQKQGQQLKE